MNDTHRYLYLSSLAKIDRLSLLDIFFRKHFCYITPAILRELNANKVAGFIVDDADGYITVNNMDAVTYQVAIPKPVQGEIDTDVGDNIEIAKSWENYISKKVSGNAKDDYVAVLKSAVGSLKIDKKRVKKLQERTGGSMLVSE